MTHDDWFYDNWDFYWENIDPKDIQHERPQRCAWCHGIYTHTELCKKQLDAWSIRMPFGKHKGKLITEIPAGYLEWMAKKCHSLNEDLRKEIERVRPDLSVYLQRLDEEHDDDF